MTFANLNSIYSDKTSDLEVGDEVLWLTGAFAEDDTPYGCIRELDAAQDVYFIIEVLQDAIGRDKYVLRRKDGRTIKGIYRAALGAKPK